MQLLINDQKKKKKEKKGTIIAMTLGEGRRAAKRLVWLCLENWWHF
jgi:hypothetical protein